MDIPLYLVVNPRSAIISCLESNRFLILLLQEAYFVLCSIHHQRSNRFLGDFALVFLLLGSPWLFGRPLMRLFSLLHPLLTKRIWSFSRALLYFPPLIRDSLNLAICIRDSTFSWGNLPCIMPRKFFDWWIFSLRASKSELADWIPNRFFLDFTTDPLRPIFCSCISWFTRGSLLLSISIISWVTSLIEAENLRFKSTKSFHPRDSILVTGSWSNLGCAHYVM